MKIQLKSKTKTTFIISVDEVLWGILPAKILRFFSLHPDMENTLPNSEKEKLIAEIEKYSWNKLLNFLSYRERSVWECRSFLKQNFLMDQLIEKLVKKASDNNFVNDERFAGIYVNDLIAKNRNNLEIKAKLYEKHVAADTIQRVLSEQFTKNTEQQVLTASYHKAVSRFHNQPAEKRKEKILNYLTRKGFSYWQVKEKMDKDGY